MPLGVSSDDTGALVDFLEKTTSRPSFLIIYASPRPSDGLMWCGDCRRAEPLISEKFSKGSTNVRTVYAGTEVEWRTLTNPYRQPPFSIEKLPTILKVYENGWHRLVEEHCYDQQKLDDFVDRS
ncbi:hypothetical protein EJ08DRAFT_483972 [Tothia fuscella]|uniref:Thioredoxin domain-containing protein n=1 Tax=Tothia fuscella TaxID=1048955 RepID=A0A9P4TUL6_9PEZI|nr:hypothetical protein EJ08DRAFT_483972 [Tothia fuscella]